MNHNLQLSWLRNRWNILAFIAIVILVISLIVGLVALEKVEQTSQENEDSLKGITCILLIVPENRNPDNVTECIRINSGEGTNFQLPLESVEVMTIEGERGQDGYTPVKGIDYFDGINGTNGANGKDGKDAPSAYELWLSEGNTGSLSEFLASLEGEPGQPGKQLIIQCIGGFFMSQYEGDLEWQIIGTGCDG